MIKVDILIAILIIVVILICVIFVVYASSYNRFQDYIIRINEVEASIDTSLRSKYDFINRCVSIIKSKNEEVKNDSFEEIANNEEIEKLIKNIEDVNDKLDIEINYYNKNISEYNRLINKFPYRIIALLNKYQEKLYFDRKNMADDDFEDFKL